MFLFTKMRPRSVLRRRNMPKSKSEGRALLQLDGLCRRPGLCWWNLRKSFSSENIVLQARNATEAVYVGKEDFANRFQRGKIVLRVLVAAG